MSEQPIKYRRLPGRGRRRGFLSATGVGTLWQGPDHILSLERSWAGEQYKRFYFRDVQAITLQQTNGANAWSWAWGSLAVAFAILFGLLIIDPSDAPKRFALIIWGGSIVSACLIFLLINYLRGPSCVCRVSTAVQVDELPSLRRVRTAQRVITMLKPLIEETQGNIDPVTLESRVADAPAKAPPPRPVSAPMLQPGQPATPTRPFDGRVHIALFSVMLADSLVGLFTHLHPTWRAYLPVSGLLLMLVTGLCITALIRQRQMQSIKPLETAVAFAFGWDLVAMGIVFAYGMAARMMYAVTHPGQLPTSIEFQKMAGFPTLSLFGDVIELGLGVAGLFIIATKVSAANPPTAEATRREPDDSVH